MANFFKNQKREAGFAGKIDGSMVKITLAGLILLGSFVLAYFLIPGMFPAVYTIGEEPALAGGVASTSAEEVFKATHLPTPKPLKAIYITSWVAGTGYWRESLRKLVNETDLNAVVIDIKDYSGAISF